jgi:hypothetical protein
MVNSTISRPKEILAALIKSDPSKRVLHQMAWVRRWFAEKPKVGELQMDWLRSEDLKEEKNLTASITIVAGQRPMYSIRLSPVKTGARRAKLQT